MCLLLITLAFASCSPIGGSTNNAGNKNSSPTQSAKDGSTNVSPNVTADAVTPAPQVKLGAQPCPAVVSNPTHWDAIIGTQSGVSAVSRVTCANLIGNPTLQALILVGYQGTGNVVDVYVYNNITSPSPTQLFKLQNLYKGDARIGGYNTILTAEVDQNSSVNKNTGGANAQQPDLFREFKWSDGAGTFAAVPFPGLFPVLTRYQAETDQQQVNQGHQPWQLSASMTAQALAANLLKWAPNAPATIVQGGGKQDIGAIVDVKHPNPGGTIRVTMTRLYGNRNGGIWIATGVTTPGMSIDVPKKNDRLTSPVNVAGMSKAFEGKAGTIRILDHTETDIGHADVQPAQGMGNTTYTATVSYNSTFKTGTQEGIVALYLISNADGSIAGVVMIKVLLG